MSTEMTIEIRLADYQNARDKELVVELLNGYAKDPMGGGEELAEYTKQNLAECLAKIPHAFSVLAFYQGQPAGLINCFEGFSTFKCKPIINIHDATVLPDFRGKGLSLKMMDKVEEIARERGACKITLEVLEGNKVAQGSYLKFGFSGYELDPKMGQAMFWEKPLR